MWRLVVCACLFNISSVLGDTLLNPSTSPGSGGSRLWNATWTDLLKHDLLMKYDKFARPAQHTNITEVKLGLTVKHIEIDEARSLMIMNAWSVFRWTDEKLKWNSSDYGGIKVLHLADHEIWQPDIMLYNSALGHSVDLFGSTLCIVYPNGSVLWVPPSQFSVYCDINLRKWPYDSQTCQFFFGSWSYNGQDVLLKKMRSNESSDGYMELEPMVQWTVESVKEFEHVRIYACCSEPYNHMEVIVTVKRKSPAYAAVVFIPAIVCLVLTLAMFWLPPHASDKFLLAGVAAIIESMFLIYLSHKLPGTGNHVPLVVEFYGYSLLLVSLSVVVSVLTVNMSRRNLARPVPWIITRALTRYSAFLGLPNNKNEFASMTDCEELHERCLVDRGRTESMDAAHQTSAQTTREWTLLAAALDRAMFLLYVIIFLLIAISFLVSDSPIKEKINW